MTDKSLLSLKNIVRASGLDDRARCSIAVVLFGEDATTGGPSAMTRSELSVSSSISCLGVCSESFCDCAEGDDGGEVAWSPSEADMVVEESARVCEGEVSWEVWS